MDSDRSVDQHISPDQRDSVTPRYVVDGLGNIWHHFNDTGYLRLVVTEDPGKSLAQIVTETGAVTALAIRLPTDVLREALRVNAD